MEWRRSGFASGWTPQTSPRADAVYVLDDSVVAAPGEGSFTVESLPVTARLCYAVTTPNTVFSGTEA